MLNKNNPSSEQKDPSNKRLKDYPDVLSVNDMKEILGVNAKTVYKLLKDGKIKHFRINAMYRVTKRNMMEFLNSNSDRGMELDNEI